MMGQDFGFIKGQVVVANGFFVIHCSVKEKKLALED